MAHLAVPLGLVVGYASGVVTEDFDGLGIVIREQRRHEVKRGTLDKLAAQVSDAQLARGIFSLDAPLFLNLSAREPVSKSLAGSSDRLPRLVRRVEKAIQVECLKLGSCPSRIDNDPGLPNGGIQIAEGGTSHNQLGPAFAIFRCEAKQPCQAMPRQWVVAAVKIQRSEKAERLDCPRFHLQSLLYKGDRSVEAPLFRACLRQPAQRPHGTWRMLQNRGVQRLGAGPVAIHLGCGDCALTERGVCSKTAAYSDSARAQSPHPR